MITSASECEEANAALGNVHSASGWSAGMSAHSYSGAAYLPEGCVFMYQDSRGLTKGLNYATHNRGFAQDVRDAELAHLYSICKYTDATASDPAGNRP